MLSAALFSLVAGPVQADRYGVCALDEGAAKARPFGRLRDQVEGITVTGNRAYLWTEKALWWMDATGKRLVRVKGLPFVSPSGDTSLSHRVGLEPGGGLLIWSSDGRLWRVYDKATPVPGLPKGTEVTDIEKGLRRTYLMTDRGLWQWDGPHQAARPIPGLRGKVTGLAEVGEGTLISHEKEGLLLSDGIGAPPKPIAGPIVGSQVLSGYRWRNRALIFSQEGLWSLGKGETAATFLPGSEKMATCYDFEMDGRRLWGWGGIEGTLRFYDFDRKAFGVIANFRNEVTCMLARSNDVLVGTYFSGVFRIDKRTLTVRQVPFAGNGGGTISDLVPFGKQVLIGTRRGMPH